MIVSLIVRISLLSLFLCDIARLAVRIRTAIIYSLFTDSAGLILAATTTCRMTERITMMQVKRNTHTNSHP